MAQGVSFPINIDFKLGGDAGKLQSISQSLQQLKTDLSELKKEQQDIKVNVNLAGNFQAQLKEMKQGIDTTIPVKIIPANKLPEQHVKVILDLGYAEKQLDNMMKYRVFSPQTPVAQNPFVRGINPGGVSGNIPFQGILDSIGKIRAQNNQAQTSDLRELKKGFNLPINVDPKSKQAMDSHLKSNLANLECPLTKLSLSQSAINKIKSDTQTAVNKISQVDATRQSMPTMNQKFFADKIKREAKEEAERDRMASVSSAGTGGGGKRGGGGGGGVAVSGEPEKRKSTVGEQRKDTYTQGEMIVSKGMGGLSTGYDEARRAIFKAQLASWSAMFLVQNPLTQGIMQHGRQAYKFTEQTVGITDELSRMKLSLFGATRSQPATQNLMNLARQIELTSVGTFKDIFSIMSGLGVMPALKPTLTQGTNKEIKKLVQTTQMLGMLNPFGMEGAQFIMQEFMAGKIYNVGRRLNVTPDMMLAVAGSSRTRYQAATAVERAGILGQYTRKVMGEDTLERFNETFKATMENMHGYVEVLQNQVGEGGAKFIGGGVSGNGFYRILTDSMRGVTSGLQQWQIDPTRAVSAPDRSWKQPESLSRFQMLGDIMGTWLGTITKAGANIGHATWYGTQEKPRGLNDVLTDKITNYWSELNTIKEKGGGENAYIKKLTTDIGKFSGAMVDFRKNPAEGWGKVMDAIQIPSNVKDLGKVIVTALEESLKTFIGQLGYFGVAAAKAFFTAFTSGLGSVVSGGMKGAKEFLPGGALLQFALPAMLAMRLGSIYGTGQGFSANLANKSMGGREGSWSQYSSGMGVAGGATGIGGGMLNQLPMLMMMRGMGGAPTTGQRIKAGFAGRPTNQGASSWKGLFGGAGIDSGSTWMRGIGYGAVTGMLADDAFGGGIWPSMGYGIAGQTMGLMGSNYISNKKLSSTIQKQQRFGYNPTQQFMASSIPMMLMAGMYGMGQHQKEDSWLGTMATSALYMGGASALMGIGPGVMQAKDMVSHASDLEKNEKRLANLKRSEKMWMEKGGLSREDLKVIGKGRRILEGDLSPSDISLAERVKSGEHAIRVGGISSGVSELINKGVYAKGELGGIPPKGFLGKVGVGVGVGADLALTGGMLGQASSSLAKSMLAASESWRESGTNAKTLVGSVLGFASRLFSGPGGIVGLMAKVAIPIGIAAAVGYGYNAISTNIKENKVKDAAAEFKGFDELGKIMPVVMPATVAFQEGLKRTQYYQMGQKELQRHELFKDWEESGKATLEKLKSGEMPGGTKEIWGKSAGEISETYDKQSKDVKEQRAVMDVEEKHFFDQTHYSKSAKGEPQTKYEEMGMGKILPSLIAGATASLKELKAMKPREKTKESGDFHAEEYLEIAIAKLKEMDKISKEEVAPTELARREHITKFSKATGEFRDAASKIDTEKFSPDVKEKFNEFKNAYTPGVAGKFSMDKINYMLQTRKQSQLDLTQQIQNRGENIIKMYSAESGQAAMASNMADFAYGRTSLKGAISGYNENFLKPMAQAFSEYEPAYVDRMKETHTALQKEIPERLDKLKEINEIEPDAATRGKRIQLDPKKLDAWKSQIIDLANTDVSLDTRIDIGDKLKVEVKAIVDGIDAAIKEIGMMEPTTEGGKELKKGLIEKYKEQKEHAGDIEAQTESLTDANKLKKRMEALRPMMEYENKQALYSSLGKTMGEYTGAMPELMRLGLPLAPHMANALLAKGTIASRVEELKNKPELNFKEATDLAKMSSALREQTMELKYMPFIAQQHEEQFAQKEYGTRYGMQEEFFKKRMEFAGAMQPFNPMLGRETALKHAKELGENVAELTAEGADKKLIARASHEAGMQFAAAYRPGEAMKYEAEAAKIEDEQRAKAKSDYEESKAKIESSGMSAEEKHDALLEAQKDKMDAMTGASGTPENKLLEAAQTSEKASLNIVESAIIINKAADTMAEAAGIEKEKKGEEEKGKEKGAGSETTLDKEARIMQERKEAKAAGVPYIESTPAARILSGANEEVRKMEEAKDAGKPYESGITGWYKRLRGHKEAKLPQNETPLDTQAREEQEKIDAEGVEAKDAERKRKEKFYNSLSNRGEGGNILYGRGTEILTGGGGGGPKVEGEKATAPMWFGAGITTVGAGYANREASWLREAAGAKAGTMPEFIDYSNVKSSADIAAMRGNPITPTASKEPSFLSSLFGTVKNERGGVDPEIFKSLVRANFGDAAQAVYSKGKAGVQSIGKIEGAIENLDLRTPENIPEKGGFPEGIITTNEHVPGNELQNELFGKGNEPNFGKEVPFARTAADINKAMKEEFNIPEELFSAKEKYFGKSGREVPPEMSEYEKNLFKLQKEQPLRNVRENLNMTERYATPKGFGENLKGEIPTEISMIGKIGKIAKGIGDIGTVVALILGAHSGTENAGKIFGVSEKEEQSMSDKEYLAMKVGGGLVGAGDAAMNIATLGMATTPSEYAMLGRGDTAGYMKKQGLENFEGTTHLPFVPLARSGALGANLFGGVANLFGGNFREDVTPGDVLKSAGFGAKEETVEATPLPSMGFLPKGKAARKEAETRYIQQLGQTPGMAMANLYAQGGMADQYPQGATTAMEKYMPGLAAASANMKEEQTTASLTQKGFRQFNSESWEAKTNNPEWERDKAGVDANGGFRRGANFGIPSGEKLEDKVIEGTTERLPGIYSMQQPGGNNLYTNSGMGQALTAQNFTRENVEDIAWGKQHPSAKATEEGNAWDLFATQEPKAKAPEALEEGNARDLFATQEPKLFKAPEALEEGNAWDLFATQEPKLSIAPIEPGAIAKEAPIVGNDTANNESLSNTIKENNTGTVPMSTSLLETLMQQSISINQQLLDTAQQTLGATQENNVGISTE